MRHNQKGRSMVEMLGVLAIVGVLSVGGVAGYSAAMHKYKVNKIANTLINIFNNYGMLKDTVNCDGINTEDDPESLENMVFFPIVKRY